MYWRPFIREGDTLTPGGGVVQPVPQQCPVSYAGKNACFEGDPVYCNTCKSWGITKCVPPYRPHTAPDGRQANLDGDLCICKCSTPPRLKTLSDNTRMGFEEHEIARMAGAEPWLQYSGYKSFAYDQHFLAQDIKTGKPLENVKYKITLDDGREFIGFTDSNGLTEKVFSNSPQTATIEVPYYGNNECNTNPCRESDACGC